MTDSLKALLYDCAEIDKRVFEALNRVDKWNGDWAKKRIKSNVKAGLKLRYPLHLPEKDLYEKNMKLYQAVVSGLADFPKLIITQDTMILTGIDIFACVSVIIPKK